MSIVQDYLDLTKKYQAEYGAKTIVLMEVGSFYEVYALIKPDGTYMGSHIEDFARKGAMNRFKLPASDPGAHSLLQQALLFPLFESLVGLNNVVKFARSLR